ncbi:hypothetical protein PPYR_13504 [Photinus pyralis]|uniref:BAG domain-containing protein n=1 Tax=Photinus pyralis TaxID=7054 RepID=A0A1Y1N8K7_PHOPY|nr:BAG domain-containing protein Samui-like isoform X2 [Photinus pyralis]KAB0793884.1 hypothetical protein PPYR_13504 [Photinus pyralis]
MPFSRPAFTGFPFDDSDLEERDRSRSFRSTLDDIAKRHPEFAEHLNFEKFPIRTNTWGHRRRGSGDHPKANSFDEFAECFNRPSGSRFKEKFGFPFNNSFDAPPEQYSEPAQTSPKPTEESKPPQVPKERGRKPNPNIPQSSTVDLGQKQEPISDIRGQRSMSAPPENRTGQRFVSSINIPINPETPDANAAQQQRPPSQTKCNERVIPIHVEGRDEPVIPKQQTNQTYTQPPPPQSEKMFGHQRPGFGTWKRDDHPYYTGDQRFFQQDPNFDGVFGQERSNFPPSGTSKQQTQPSPSQKPPTPPPQQAPLPQPTKFGPIEQIQGIQKDVLELMNQVEQFNGRPKDKQYVYLDEMLTRNLLKLDDVETEGKENIRHARKEAINCIQKCISILEAKAMANEQLRCEVMDVDTKADETPPLTTLEVSGISRSGSENISNEMEQEQIPAEAVTEVPVTADAESKETELKNTHEEPATPAETVANEAAQESVDSSQVQQNEESKEKKKVKKKGKTE